MLQRPIFFVLLFVVLFLLCLIFYILLSHVLLSITLITAVFFPLCCCCILFSCPIAYHISHILPHVRITKPTPATTTTTCNRNHQLSLSLCLSLSLSLSIYLSLSLSLSLCLALSFLPSFLLSLSHKHRPNHKYAQAHSQTQAQTKVQTSPDIVALHCNFPCLIHSQEHPKCHGKRLNDALRKAPDARCCGWIDPSDCTHHECSHPQLTTSNALLLFTSPATVLHRTSSSLGKASGKAIAAKKVVGDHYLAPQCTRCDKKEALLYQNYLRCKIFGEPKQKTCIGWGGWVDEKEPQREVPCGVEMSMHNSGIQFDKREASTYFQTCCRHCRAAQDKWRRCKVNMFLLCHVVMFVNKSYAILTFFFL